jgi:hypothetical protein
MAGGTGRAFKNHYGRHHPKAGRLDRNDDPVSLLEGGKINLAGSRFDDSQANRAALDGASSRSAQDWFGCERRGIGSCGTSLAYRPEYFVSGHDHAFPYKSGQSWNQRMGEVCVLVPGQLMSAPFPNHIKLDTESGESSWQTNRETWMPEDDRFEYLLLKFAKQ